MRGRQGGWCAEAIEGEGIQVWARVIVPLGLTPEEGDALVAAERDKLPAGTGIVVLRII
jgi:hypothetical protein